MSFPIDVQTNVLFPQSGKGAEFFCFFSWNVVVLRIVLRMKKESCVCAVFPVARSWGYVGAGVAGGGGGVVWCGVAFLIAGGEMGRRIYWRWEV